MQAYYRKLLKAKIDSVIDINCLECNEFRKPIQTSVCMCESIYDTVLEKAQEFADEWGLNFDSAPNDHDTIDFYESDVAEIWEELRDEWINSG